MRPNHPAIARAASPACEALEARRLFAAELLSVAAGGGATGNGASPPDGEFVTADGPASAVSDDGRYIVFLSDSTDLVPGVFDAPAPVGSAASNVYVRDRVAHTTTLVSIRADGKAAGNSRLPSISGDGRYVAFVSSGGGIIPNDTASTDVYVRDLVAGTTALASHTAAGAPAGGESTDPTISRNGRYVTFLSEAADLPGTPAGTALNFPGVFRYDVQTGAVAGVAATQVLNGIGARQQMSDDGNVVAYVATRDGGDLEVYVKDMTTGVETLASATASGRPVQFSSVPAFELSGDGRHVAFTAVDRATANDVNDMPDVFVRDLAAGTTVLASVASDGNSVAGPAAEGSDLGAGPRALSADGRFVLVETTDQLTGVADRGGATYFDVYLRDLQSGTTTLLSVDPAGDDPEEAQFATLSADGTLAAFVSARPATDLTKAQVVVVDVATGTQTSASLGPGGAAYDLARGIGSGIQFSRADNVVVFAGETDASALLPGVADGNDTFDVFAFPLAASGVDVTPPTVATTAGMAGVSAPTSAYDFSLTWTDDVAVDAASIGNGDVVATGPNGYREPATLVSVSAGPAANQLVAVYRLAGPGGAFDPGDNGNYVIEVAAGEVKDAAGNFAASVPVAGGTFVVGIPALADGPDLQAVSLQGAVPESVVSGAKQKLRPLSLTVTNAGNQPAAGTVTLRLVASADETADATDTTVAEGPAKLKLAPGKSKTFKLKAKSFPAVADGEYHLLAVVDAAGVLPERVESNNAALLAAPVRIAAPYSDVAVMTPVLSGKLAAGKKASLVATLTNAGNTTARGGQPARVRLTTDPANPAAPSRTVNLPLKLKLKPGATKTVKSKLTLPADLVPGTYFVAVDLLPGTPWNDPVGANNTATSAAGVVV
jgi:Tol biopolymer transport system component